MRSIGSRAGRGPRCPRWGLVLTALLVAAGPAGAAGRTLVIGSGRCESPDLIIDVLGLTKELKARDPGVLEDSEFRELVGPPPSASVTEVEAQFANAQHSFYFGHISSARRQFESVVHVARQLPPSDAKWPLIARILAFRGMFLFRQGRNDTFAAQQSFTELLRVDPRYVLNSEQFAPETSKLFNEVRRDLRQLPNLSLEVKSEPAGASIFIDGKFQGKTPTTLSLPPAGPYPFVLSKDGVTSFPHPIDVQTEKTLDVDFSVEGALSTQRYPCLNTRVPSGDVTPSALKLGRLLGVDQVVVLSLPSGGNWLHASLVEVERGQKMRDGAIKVTPGEQNPEGLPDLATFVLTGNGRNVVKGAAPSPPSPPPPPPVATTTPAKPSPHPPHLAHRPSPPPQLAQPAPAVAAAALAPSPVRTSPAPSSSVGRDVAAWSLLGLAVVSAGVGVGLQVASSSQATQFNSAYAGVGPSADRLTDLASLRDSARGLHTGAWVLGAVAVASAAGAITLFATRPHAVRSSSVGPVLSASASVGLGSAFVTVRTP